MKNTSNHIYLCMGKNMAKWMTKNYQQTWLCHSFKKMYSKPDSVMNIFLNLKCVYIYEDFKIISHIILSKYAYHDIDDLWTWFTIFIWNWNCIKRSREVQREMDIKEQCDEVLHSLFHLWMKVGVFSKNKTSTLTWLLLYLKKAASHRELKFTIRMYWYTI